jgi:hypothetical protein
MGRAALCARLVLAWVLTTAAHAVAQDAIVLGAPISLHGVHVSGFAREGERSAGARIQNAHSVRIAVFPGRVSRSRGEARTTLHVCGVDAVRSEVAFASTPSSRVQIQGDEPSAHLIVPERPARTYVRVEIPRVVDGRAGVVSVEWSVVTARRAALRVTEEAFFASIHCDAATP